MTMITLTTGTAFIMWLGEQITERGIGNGISLIIFAGIVDRHPDAVVRMFSKTNKGDISRFDLAHRRPAIVAGRSRRSSSSSAASDEIPVQYAKRIVGRKMSTAGRRRTCR